MNESADKKLSSAKQALLEIRRLRGELTDKESRLSQPIALVGCGLRFPGNVNSVDEFWRFLQDGGNGICEIPEDRWDASEFFNESRDSIGTMYTKHAGFIANVAEFDAAFFGISPREAESMDPQHRLLLELSWRALEDALISPTSLKNSNTGVFIGFCNSDYSRLVFSDPRSPDVSAATGNEPSVAAGRISYTLGLQGPSMVVDTACSSSLVALHLAVQSLRKHECDAALVGGVNLILTPEMHINFCQAQMLSPDGQCKTFDASADGYGRGEGSAVVVAKRLSDAIADGDRIYAVVRGSAVNQDGQSAGITAPNGIAQEAVIGRALQDAGLAATDIDYVELHGTGTPLGDPIEARALGAAYGQYRDTNTPLYVGSVKTNIGHLEAAAGIAGIVKTALSLYFDEIPGQRNFSTANPEIPLRQLNLRVTDSASKWPQGSTARAGVSSFGFGGTNAHVILEKPPLLNTVELPDSSQLLSVSAETPEMLDTVTATFADYLRNTQDKLAEIAYASNVGRAHFRFRRSLVCDSHSDAAEALDSIAAGRDPQSKIWSGVATGNPRVVFAFTGQGAQCQGMGGSLYRTFPVFRDALDEAVALFAQAMPLDSLLAYITETEATVGEPGQYVQPATFSLGYALYNLWSSWGVRPEVVLGHSLGEYVAAVAAGMMDLADAVKLVAARVRLTQGLERPGQMAVVFAAASDVEELLRGNGLAVDVAAINSPENTVISGHVPEVEAALKAFAAKAWDVRILDIPQAFHSRELDPIIAEFQALLREIELRAPDIDYLSTVSGKFLGDEEGGSFEYWVSQLRETVNFAAATSALDIDDGTIIVELGAHPTLIPMLASMTTADCALVPSLSHDSDGLESLANAIAALHTRGVAVEFDSYFRSRLDGGRPRPVILPPYPFASAHYWVPDNRAGRADVPGASVWNFVTQATQLAAASAPMNLRAHELEESWSMLRELSKCYIVNALASLNLFEKAGQTATIESAMQSARIESTYQHLVKRWFALLVDEGVLQHKTGAEEFVCENGLQSMAVDNLLATLRSRYASEQFLIDYLQRCGEMLADVICGKVAALETLFPDGDATTAELLYTEFSPSRYISNIAADSILSFVAAQHRPVSILEIGAGTGGTTSRILPSLPPGFGRYVFTDISDYFLTQAADRFAGYDFVDYALLDIGQDPEPQKFLPHSQDVIVATNVLHATPDLRQTLRNVIGLLRSGGILVLCEVTRELDWYDISTGLIEGWQAFEDDLRDDSPILSASVWGDALRDAGFVDVVAVPGEDSPAFAVGQNVIVGLAPESTATSGVPAGRDSRVAESGIPADEQRQDELLADLDGLPATEQHDLLVDFVTGLVCRILRLPEASTPDADAGLFDMGMDSLLALDFRRQLATALRLDAPLPATLIFDCPNISAVAQFLLPLVADSRPEDNEPDVGDVRDRVEGALADDIERMSEADVEAALLARLDAAGKDN
tara:strand:- start:16586 stop:20983 length:4398 start_codon:yes stop_codon:yes gene_type:complete